MSLRVVARVFCVLASLLSFIQLSMAQDVMSGAEWKKQLAKDVSQSGEVTLFRVSGSNTVGAHLGPELIKQFFQAEGLSDIEEEPIGENETAVSGVWSGGERPLRFKVKVAAHGSSTGFKALELGDADLAAASRPIKAEEMLSLAEQGNMSDSQHEHIIAIDGLAIIVNPANPINKLSTTQITRLFTGQVTNWRDVGGPSAPVRIYARNDESGTFDTFERLVLQGKSLSKAARRFESNDLLARSVLKDVNGIGFTPLATIGSTKALVVSDGVAVGLAPTTLTVSTEDYPLARRLFFYAPDAAEREPALEAFLQFVASNPGQKTVEQSGFVAQALHPVKVESDDARLQNWQRLNLNIRFADGSSDLDNKALADVNRLAAFLRQKHKQAAQLTLVGYSNPGPGGKAAISRLRAQNVRWALRQQGVRSKVVTLAGESVAVADPHSVNADRNRRVEVWVQ